MGQRLIKVCWKKDTKRGDKVQQIQKWDFIAEKVKENSSKIFENEFDF